MILKERVSYETLLSGWGFPPAWFYQEAEYPVSVIYYGDLQKLLAVTSVRPTLGSWTYRQTDSS
jgi:hypothetical protein